MPTHSTFELPHVPRIKTNSRKIPNFNLKNIEKQTLACKSTAKEVSFEGSHHRISSTDSKVKTKLHASIIDFGSERVNCKVWKTGKGKIKTLKMLDRGVNHWN